MICKKCVYDNMCSSPDECQDKEPFTTGVKLNDTTVYGVCKKGYVVDPTYSC